MDTSLTSAGLAHVWTQDAVTALALVLLTISPYLDHRSGKR
jgi:hypothetical protein